MQFWIVVFIFGVVVLVFDGVWSVIAVRRGYAYVNGAGVSYLMYCLAGFTVAQVADVRNGHWAGALVALIDAVLGTPLAYRIGAYGALAPQVRRIFPLAVLLLPLIGAVLGAVGAMVASAYQ